MRANTYTAPTPNPPPNNTAHALGAADLVGREGGRVHAELLHVERYLAQGLHGIGVEEGAALVGQFG